MIYLLESKRQAALKIGITNNIDRRLQQLRTSCPDWECLRIVDLGSLATEGRIEAKIIETFKFYSIGGELFRYSLRLLGDIGRLLTSYEQGEV
ncbi:hypothetical protein NIES2135_04880 [Leptolyngbya boryana NIES-2135]|jgi:hypothetical protein|uniref:GIY-YIG nuclease family protein n=1 Tax=Leptolyngbya boryana NIES-2135 TaxID=1973484 RepID=A0A1Z4JAI0_LEPBY|nr:MULTISPECIES: GIY-YIG nuclease family protein [Leptolyngbya]BAY53678.1 hypothetical protein NIES2135_04880 [Leptolyngbya boryana NIES-2135]MBD1856589.1 GIY-YIG nuclease family protein [Leptolyngbya sp. FACHB-1624]MBD2367883.1 GIY-YIG nuclease family protein [Leptolyngbya sp. FACHB-161]MBD2374269.1 GIY-YIG nuclease family protein [Leptolyngbya sp. FACHB-238]MBD2398492.1 GIY-YIG nuclease family protein [Leptolyngbya sp. FACHB-239]